MFKEKENEELTLAPVNFFQISCDCLSIAPPFPKLSKQKGEKYLLPDTTYLCAEESFANVHMGWNKEGIELYVVIDQKLQSSLYPEVTKGDSVELFFDTRNVKTSGFNTRFCHHFVFLAEAADGVQALELTRFRTEDAHELCDPKELKVKTIVSKDGYSMQIFIPSTCLVGYDPDQFTQLGFNYRINRFKGDPQHFSAITDEYKIEQQPSLWGSVKLI